jgi:predicted HicB family RNase H-like nuclease
MAAKKKSTESRHGKLSEGTAQTSITMNKALLEKARQAAEAEGRSLSNWLEQVVKKSVQAGIIAFIAWYMIN